MLGRRLSPSLVISLLVHVAALVWLATRESWLDHRDDPTASLEWIDIEVEPAPPRPATIQAPVEPVKAPPAPAPTSVTPTVEPRPRPAHEPAPRPDLPDPPDPIADHLPPTQPGPPGVGHEAPATALSMRTQSRLEQVLGPDRRDAPILPIPRPEDAARLVERDPGPVPAPSPLAPPTPRTPPRQRSEIVPDGKGAYRAHDLTFTAKIDRDGRVHFEDKPNVQVHLNLPGPSDMARGIESWYKDPYGTAKGKKSVVETGTVPIVGGGFDVTDWLMRRSGQDPYLARKMLFLKRTHEERARMSADERTASLRDSLAMLPKQLAGIWAHDAWPAKTRRRVLFELWDECAETGSDEVLRAGESARATIMAFIRRHLPRDSSNAYTEVELRALNEMRKSSQTFAPYP